MRRLFVFLFAILFAGCTSDDPLTDAGAGAGDGGDLAPLAAAALEYTGCYEQLAVVPVPVAMVGGLLPPGYDPVTFDEAGLLAQTLVIALDCHFRGAGAQELMGAVQVIPPAEYVDDEAFAHAWLLGGWVTNETAKAAYDSWGATLMELGPVSMTTSATPVARYGYSEGGDEQFAVGFDTIVQGAEGVQSAGHARVFHAGGLANQTAPRAIQVSWNESKTMEGEAILYMMQGLPPLTEPGIGVHNWGDDYAVRIESIDLPEVG